MTRHVSLERGRQEAFKLPGIHLTNRVVNPNSDFRRVDRSPERKHQSLPPPRLNGYMVTSDHVARDGVTYYAQGRVGKDHNSLARRQQSLPSRRTEGEEKQRQANSAPSRKNRSTNQTQGSPLPKLNSLVAKSRGPGGETSHVVTTCFAGFSTKEQDASPTKSTRFASTWAQVRAENHIDMCTTTSPDGSPRKTGHEEDRSNAASRLRQSKTTSPDRESIKGSNPRSRMDFTFHAPSARDKENVKPNPPRYDPPAFMSPRTIQATKKKCREDKEKQTIRFITPEDEHDGTEHQNGESDTEEVPDTQRPASQGARNNKHRPDWDNRLALTVPQQTQPPVKSWRRYEAELTHMPTVTSNKQVYKAYTGRSRQQIRDKQITEDNDFSEQRPSTKGSSQLEEGDLALKDSEARPQKEYILTRNEAKMYVHLQNVYGSEAFRQHRKDLFFKKMTDVQLQELKQQEADKRRKQQKREESKKRQQRQLMYVRRKFRREQLHRFRTQYVTSRVLEYEKGDRDLYGLPDDSDDDDVGGFGDVDKTVKDDTREPKDNSGQSKTPDKKSPDNSTAPAVNTPRTQATQPEYSQNSDTTNTPKTGALESKAAFNHVDDKPIENAPGSKDTSNVTGSKPSPNKDFRQVNGESLRPENEGKSNLRSTNTKNSKPAPNNNNNQTSNSKPSTVSPDKGVTNPEKSENTFLSSNTAEQNGPGTKTSLRKGKQDKDDAGTAKGVATISSPRKTASTTSTTQNPPRAANAKPENSNTSDTAAKKPSDSSSPSAAEDPGALTTPSDIVPKGINDPQPAKSSLSKTTAPEKQGGKTDVKQTHSDTMDNKNKKKSLPEKSGKDNSFRTEKEDGLNNAKKNNVKNNETDNSNKNDSVQNKDKEEDNTFNRSKVIVNNDNNKRTTITKDSKGRYITTTKNFGPKDPATPNTEASNHHLTNGHVVSESRTIPSTQTTTKPAAHTKQDGITNRLAHNGNHSPTRPTDYRGRKPKPAAGKPKNEVEQKKQMEKKFGKMFGMNAGPSWNPGAKPPKMEGIDTVMIRVTDEKGRTRLKKREVKDVVKEAKDQLAAPLPDTPKRSGGKGGYSSTDHANTIRPASADTLDFDDDDDDDEDVFERVRRKYNLQIDSDDDDRTV